MQKKWISAIIITSICVAIIGGIGTYYWILKNEDKSDDDDDETRRTPPTQAVNIINHNYAHIDDFLDIPSDWITSAKNDLHIKYWHTSHGSQLTTGMAPLDTFMGGAGLYTYNSGGTGGALDIEETSDDLTSNTNGFHLTTETYLDNPSYSDVNIVMWSWCGLDTNFADIDEYLANMNLLELNYSAGGPKGRTAANAVRFVYMTGHLDGSGASGAVHLANERIRDYCINNNKILYDFADIESYDPDNNYYLDRYATDNCTYDGNNNGFIDNEDISSHNWAVEWQDDHDEDVDWYSCSAVHSQALNGNLKAYGAWYLFARLAGWKSI